MSSVDKESMYKTIGERYTTSHWFDPKQETFSYKALPLLKTFFHNYRNMVGIEVEVECKESFPAYAGQFWIYVSDGSLKENGIEYISKPVGGKNIDYALEELARLLPDTPSWSHRTSIHVHSDVRHLTSWQLRGLISFYALFENAFFSLVAEHRKGSSYCYPLTDLKPFQCKPHLGEELKYCALNIGSAKYHGTIEWRHMDGNGDMKRIRRWIQLIVKFQAWVEAQSEAQLMAKMRSVLEKRNYEALAREIFGSSLFVFGRQEWTKDCEDNVKWALVNLTKEW